MTPTIPRHFQFSLLMLLTHRQMGMPDVVKAAWTSWCRLTAQMLRLCSLQHWPNKDSRHPEAKLSLDQSMRYRGTPAAYRAIQRDPLNEDGEVKIALAPSTRRLTPTWSFPLHESDSQGFNVVDTFGGRLCTGCTVLALRLCDYSRQFALLCAHLQNWRVALIIVV